MGVEALHGIIAHPDLELVGVRVYSEAKEGRDAGELCSVEPVGVTATRNVDKLLTLGADCVCFNASDHFGIDDMVEEICRILRAGVNVSNGSATALAYPPLMPAAIEKITQATEAGQATFYFGGINPGFCTDVLPAFLATAVRDVDAVEIHEHFDISTYKDALLLARFGYGRKPEDFSSDDVEEIATYLWSPSARLVAQAIGLREYDIRISSDVAVADSPFELTGDQSTATHRTLSIEKGTINALHCMIEFLVDGTP
ncbi:hypothetical protein [Mycobacterium sp.]|uniref:hypothetical protein n=1 Tax=Mycobacterium sp. TaxID=1785 RepID=UPI003BAFC4A8